MKIFAMVLSAVLMAASPAFTGAQTEAGAAGAVGAAGGVGLTTVVVAVVAVAAVAVAANNSKNDTPAAATATGT